MADVDHLLASVPVPALVPVRQHFPATNISDVASTICAEVSGQGLLSGLPEGASVAIGVGSRGIAQLPLIVKTVVELVRSAGAKPFIVPAMGSHGGATAEGQVALLHHLGITERGVGAPLRATMEVVQLGSVRGGLPLYVDRYVAEADGVVVINRIKPHTNFRGPVESGLLKMLVVGLGKQKGADAAHALGFEHMAAHVLALSAAWLERLPLLFGVAVLENAYEQTAVVSAIPPERLESEERRLLDKARSLMPRILLDPLDVLVVDEIGKEISGLGMAPNITGRAPTQLLDIGFQVDKIAVLRLTRATDGNAAGIGLADVTTAAVEARMDRAKSYVNSLTSTTMASVKLPMVMRNDAMAIKAAVKTCHARDLNRVRAVRIRNTLQLEEIWVSEALLAEVANHRDLEVAGQVAPLVFDRAGNLRL